MAEWKKVKLGDVVQLIGGGTPKTSVSEYWNGNIPWLSVKDFNNELRYVYSTEKTITELGLNNSSTKLLEKNDIIISARGTVGQLAMIPFPMAFNQSCYGIRAKNTIDSDFLYYLLKANIFILKKNTHGSVFDTITTETLLNLSICLPPLPTQKKIAEVLSCLDAQIELNRRINENLEQQAQAIFKEWFVDNAKPEWKVGKLEDYVTIKRGGSPRPIQNYLTETGLRWLKISDVTSLNTPFIFNIAEHIKEEGLNKTVFLKAGSLVLSNSATPGIPKILAVDSCIHDGWLYFTDSKFSNEFLYLLFQHARPDFLSKGNGSIFINLKTDIVKAYQFPIPDDESLEKFQSIVGTLFGKMYQVTAENLKLAEIRDALLPKLMNGELEV